MMRMIGLACVLLAVIGFTYGIYVHPPFALINFPEFVLPGAPFNGSAAVFNPTSTAWTDIYVEMSDGATTIVVGPASIGANQAVQFFASFAGHAKPGRYWYTLQARRGGVELKNLTIPV